jgi:AraC family transcriptional regulator, regulatory protein of adaptative response / DNA-3-methyladenine glycosylase II
VLPDADVCYRALRSRDARFDGRLFVGVSSTGVYCRPVCPARTPLLRNCRFYPSAAAAAQAGFRPCRRCRPEAAPGSPAWLGTSAAVSRALRLVAEGALDREGVDALAARVGAGGRHLRRLFEEHLGASPLAVAQTRRVHFAKKLLDETALPITEIAHASGFASLRRFNDAMKRAFRAAPRELRRGRARIEPAATLTLRLAARPPFDGRAVLAYLALRELPGVEHVAGAVYRRSVEVGGERDVIAVRLDPAFCGVRLELPARLVPEAARIAGRVRRLFDLDADPAPILAQLRRDPALAARLRRLRGLRVPGAWSGFELAVRAVLGQQVTVAGARTLAGRLAATHGRKLEAAEEPITHAFPDAAALAGADLSGLGMPRARAEALRALARAAASGALDLEGGQPPGAVRRALLALPGVGPWTAEYVALRALGEPDAFPASDLGLRRALGPAGQPLATQALEQRSKDWQPWRAYAAILLWSTPRSGDVP